MLTDLSTFGPVILPRPRRSQREWMSCFMRGRMCLSCTSACKMDNIQRHATPAGFRKIETKPKPSATAEITVHFSETRMLCLISTSIPLSRLIVLLPGLSAFTLYRLYPSLPAIILSRLLSFPRHISLLLLERMHWKK